jgi:hypothetical protein
MQLVPRCRCSKTVSGRCRCRCHNRLSRMLDNDYDYDNDNDNEPPRDFCTAPLGTQDGLDFLSVIVLAECSITTTITTTTTTTNRLGISVPPTRCSITTRDFCTAPLGTQDGLDFLSVSLYRYNGRTGSQQPPSERYVRDSVSAQRGLQSRPIGVFCVTTNRDDPCTAC